MAHELGPFPSFAENRSDMLRVMRNHWRAAHGQSEGYEGLSTLPVALSTAFTSSRAFTVTRPPCRAANALAPRR